MNHLRLMLVAVITVLITAFPVSVGFAEGPYDGTAVNVSNSVQSDYFTVGFYQSDGITPATTLISGTLSCSDVSSPYTVSNTNVGALGLKLVLNNSSHTSADGQYAITGSWTCSTATNAGSYIKCYMGSNATYTDNDSFRMYRDTDANNTSTSIDISAGTRAVYFDMNLLFDVKPTTFTVTLTFNVSDNNLAGYENQQSITISASDTYSQIVQNNGNSTTVVSGSDEDNVYQLIDSGTVTGNDGTDHDSIYVQGNEQGGVSEGNGVVNLSLKIPKNQAFIVKFVHGYSDNVHNGHGQRFRFSIVMTCSTDDSKPPITIVSPFTVELVDSNVDEQTGEGIAYVKAWGDGGQICSAIPSVSNSDEWFHMPDDEDYEDYDVLTFCITDNNTGGGSNSYKIQPDTKMYLVFSEISSLGPY